MARRPRTIGMFWACVLVFGGCGVVMAAPPVLTSAASRMTHAGAGAFDIPLPLSGGSGIECRQVSAGTTLVLTFDQPVTSASIRISPATAKVSGSPAISGTTVAVKLTGLANAKAYSVSISNVVNSAGEAGSASVTFRTLKGDVNASGSVTAADVNAANALLASAATVGAGTFRNDIDLSGTLTKVDVSAIKSMVGTSVAGGASADPGPAVASAATVKSAATAQPTLFLATMTPASGVTNSLGYGSAVLSLSADQTNAVLHFSYSNLTTPEVAEHIHGPAPANANAGIIFDIDKPAPPSPSPQPLPDNSWQWVFDTSPTAQYTPAQFVNFIQTGQTYINVHTSQWPGGEIRGQFLLANGSQTFTPPAAPPAITINPPSQYDASRFLQQAAFGGQLSEVKALSNPNAANASTAINDWLTQQFNTPLPIAPDYSAAAAPTATTFSPSSMYKPIYDRVTTPQAPNAYADALNSDRVPECWWGNVVGGSDQLRQRIATAYSEFFVVSEIDGTVNNNIPGLATYYDMLADDAFVNFRKLLGDVTLHPIMGQYLNMRGNNYSTTTSPNENYAREVMQLFTIGLYMLQPDGTLMLDQNGQPIPTYGQSEITSIAHVFTGWNTNGTAVVIPTFPAPKAPATQPTVVNFSSYYQKPMVVTASKHSPKAKQLLVYPGAATYPAATQPAYIPANTSQTATTATNELNFALDNIFNHPNVGPFVCKSLIQRLVCSNPSPGYVYRVAKVFADDGTSQHVRGNMQAVITAILTDYEARSPAVLSVQGFGHMREPMIRIANILRPMHAYSKSQKWKVGKTDTTLNQTIFRSPTVFNFFSPTFSQPGPIQNAGLASPEFDIIYETTLSNAHNMIYTGIYSNGSGTGFRGDNYGGDVYLDHSSKGSGLLGYLATYGMPATLDQISVLMNGAPLDSTTKSTIQNFIANNVSSTDSFGQVSAALHLVATSPRGATQE